MQLKVDCHLYTEKKEAYESALNTARNNVRNRYVEEFQKKYNTASKEEKNYYILNETPEQKNARYLKEHGLDGNKGQNDQNVQNNRSRSTKTENNGDTTKLVKQIQNKLVKLFPKQAINNLLIN